MEDCDQLLAVIRNDAAAQEWAGACSSLKAMFEKLPADTKAALVASDGCVPALLHAIARECDASCSDDGTQAAALRGACEALNALITDLPKGVKQTLLSGDKGVVDELLRVLSDARCRCAWGSVGFCFRNLFLNVDAEARQQLLSDGRGIVEAIVGVLDGDEAAAWEGACGAMRAFPIDLCVDVKQSMLSGDKGLVRALLRILGETKGKAAWDNACRCFWSMFTGISADCREALLSDGRGIVEAIVGVLDGDEAAAWAGAGGALNTFLSDLSASAKQSLLGGDKGVVARILGILGDSNHGAWGSACSFMSALLADLPPSAKSMFLLSQPQLVATIVSRLENEDSHSCWGGAMELLKRLVYQAASLSHIDLSTLDFLKKDCGLVAVLLRCSRGCSTDDEGKRFQSVCYALLKLSLSSSNSPCIAMSCEVLTLAVAAAQHCSYDPALKLFGNAISNFSENVAHCSVLAQAKCHEFALSKIDGASASNAAWSDAHSVLSYSLSIIANMSRNEALHAELKQGRVIEIVARLAEETCPAQLRALMVMSYIIGCKESTGSPAGASSPLSQLANSSSIGKVVDCLENTLNLKGGPGCSFGYIVLPAILQVRGRNAFLFRSKEAR